MVDTLRSLARPGRHKAFDEARKEGDERNCGTEEEAEGPRVIREKCDGSGEGGEEGWRRERGSASSWHPGRT